MSVENSIQYGKNKEAKGHHSTVSLPTDAVSAPKTLLRPHPQLPDPKCHPSTEESPLLPLTSVPVRMENSRTLMDISIREAWGTIRCLLSSGSCVRRQVCVRPCGPSLTSGLQDCHGSYPAAADAPPLPLGESPAVLPQGPLTCPGHTFLSQHPGCMWEVPEDPQDTLTP